MENLIFCKWMMLDSFSKLLQNRDTWICFFRCRKDPIGFTIIKSPFGSFGIFCLRFFHPHLKQSQIQKKWNDMKMMPGFLPMVIGGFVQTLGFQAPCCDQSIGPCIGPCMKGGRSKTYVMAHRPPPPSTPQKSMASLIKAGY